MKPAMGKIACVAALLFLGCSSQPEAPVSQGAPSARPSADQATRLVNPEWQVVSMGTAPDALVITVEARHPSEALTIARRLVEPVKGKYTEVLVYVRRPGHPPVLARRVQWTRTEGYREIVYSREE